MKKIISEINAMPRKYYTHKRSFDEVSKYELFIAHNQEVVDTLCAIYNVLVDQPYGIAVDSEQGIWITWDPDLRVWDNITEVRE